MCPYCVQDMRDEDRRKQETPVSKPRVEAYAIPEQCDRCGRNLDSLVYFWNGRKLCKNCVEAEKEKWGLVGGGPMSAPYRVSLAPERRRKKMSFLESLISDALHLLGIRKRKQMEVIVINDKMPISLAKPMAERAMEGGAERPAAKPETEGIMKKQPIVSPKQMKWDSAKSEVHKLAGKGAIVSKKPRHRRRKAKGDGKKNQ